MHRFEQKLLDSWAKQDWEDLTILLAVSGGGDSVALLRAIATIRESSTLKPSGRVIVAHFNHQLRGPDSDCDAHFVSTLCQTLGLDCIIGTPDSPLSQTTTPSRSSASAEVRIPSSTHQGEGLESLARHARYDFLEKTAAQLGARYLVTAHTFDDQVETVLHRILRGTGLRGLCGIARARRLNRSLTLLRPMLEVRRDEILAYLNDLGQPFREDATNTDRTFTRNRLRHDLLPILREDYNPAFDEALVRLAHLARENQTFLDQTLDRLTETSVHQTASTSVLLHREPLLSISPYLLREFLIRLWSRQNWPQQAMSYDHWDRLAALIKDDSPPNPQVAFPGTITIEWTPQTIRLRFGAP